MLTGTVQLFYHTTVVNNYSDFYQVKSTKSSAILQMLYYRIPPTSQSAELFLYHKLHTLSLTFLVFPVIFCYVKAHASQELFPLWIASNHITKASTCFPVSAQCDISKQNFPSKTEKHFLFRFDSNSSLYIDIIWFQSIHRAKVLCIRVKCEGIPSKMQTNKLN